MFFVPGDHQDHGLPHNPFKGCIVPRPIAWVSTLSSDGVPNLAPFSFFNAFSEDPPVVGIGFSPDGRGLGIKDSLCNIEETGEFVLNLVSWEQRHAMNASSNPLPPETDEFEAAGLEKLPSRLIKAPRVAGAPVHFECRLLQVVDLPKSSKGGRNAMALGQVVGIHIDEAYLTDGKVDAVKMRPLARLGYKDYAAVEEVFELVRPSEAAT